MKQKISVENIELMFPDDVFIRGEELYESGAVTESNQIEKNLFSFIVKDGVRYEVEWLRPLAKHQKASCDCAGFKLNKICSHAVAALLSYKASLPVTEKNVVRPENIRSGLSLTHLLENVSKEELKSFLKSYAQTDNRLATALKVHFARKVDLQDNEKKYRSIMDAIIKPVTTGSATIKISDVKSLNKIAAEFIGQANDALALQQYGEAFILAKATLTKLSYTRHHCTYAEDIVDKNIQQCHQILEITAQKAASPEVRDSVVQFLTDLSNYSYYPYINLSENAVLSLMRLNSLPKNISEIIRNQLWRKRENEHQLIILCAIQVVVQHFLKTEVSLDPRHLHLADKVATELYREKFYDDVDALCRVYAENNKELPLIHIQSLAAYKPKSLAQVAAGHFVRFKDLKLVDYIRQELSNEVFTRFRSEVEKKSKALQSDSLFFCQYLYRSRQDAALLHWMQQNRDFRLLMSIDEYLYPLFPAEITVLYEEMTEDFLNKHVGQHAYVFIDELIQHLHKVKANKIANKISLLIEMKFPHRSRMSDFV